MTLTEQFMKDVAKNALDNVVIFDAIQRINGVLDSKPKFEQCPPAEPPPAPACGERNEVMNTLNTVYARNITEQLDKAELSLTTEADNALIRAMRLMVEFMKNEPPPAPAGNRLSHDELIKIVEQHLGRPYDAKRDELYLNLAQAGADRGPRQCVVKPPHQPDPAARIRSEPPAEIGIFCQHVNDILDGKDDGSGLNYEPWGALRKRLVELVKKPAGCVLPSRDEIIAMLRQYLAADYRNACLVADKILSQPQQPKGGVW